MTMHWTTPYYGVTHLRWAMDKRFQITANERCPTYSDGYVLDLFSATPYTPIAEFQGATLEAVRIKAQAWVEQHGG